MWFLAQNWLVPVTLKSPFGNRVCTNPDTVPATQHKLALSDSLYLVPSFPLGSMRTMFFIEYQNSFWGKRLASSLGIKESKALGLLEPAKAILQRAFCLLSTLAQKALWYPSSLSIFH